MESEFTGELPGEAENEGYYRICNESSIDIWDDDLGRFGNCFSLALFGFIPAVLFAAVSAYFLGHKVYHNVFGDFFFGLGLRDFLGQIVF